MRFCKTSTITTRPFPHSNHRSSLLSTISFTWLFNCRNRCAPIYTCLPFVSYYVTHLTWGPMFIGMGHACTIKMHFCSPFPLLESRWASYVSTTITICEICHNRHSMIWCVCVSDVNQFLVPFCVQLKWFVNDDYRQRKSILNAPHSNRLRNWCNL